MRHLVPALECRGILEPEVGGEVDDAYARGDELACLRHRDAVRRGEEHDVAGLEIGIRGVGEREIVQPGSGVPQAREHRGDLRAGILARRDRANLGLRVRREQPQQFDARVSRPADDADLDHQAMPR